MELRKMGCMNFDADEYLASFVNWEPRLDKAGVSSFSLDRMEGLLGVVRHPQSGLLFAHIAGSKGKGSTAVFLANILREAGHRVGLYTSPHMYSVRERIRVLEPAAVLSSNREGAGQDPFEGTIPAAAFDELLRTHQENIDHWRASGREVTYYELLTALAAVYFAVKKVRVVVLETGLGGRLDATNCFETSVCGITPIGLEHTAILGETRTRIAVEKAAIIKSPFQRAVFARQEPDVMAVLEERARAFGIQPTVIGRDMPVTVTRETPDGVYFHLSGRREYGGLKTRLAGHYQAENAALATAMAEDLEAYGLVLTEEAVRRGIAAAIWPGRFEVFDTNPLVVIDSAHTPESAAACVNAFQKIFPGRKALLLFGISSDKNTPGVCAAFWPVIEAVVAVRADHPRAFHFSAQDLEEYFPLMKCSVFDNVISGLAAARRLAGREGVILAAGSVFLAAEVRKECTSTRHM